MNLETLFYEVISPQRKFYHVPMYAFLLVVSFFYKWIQKIRVRFYSWGFFKTHRLPVRVISVGNMTLGGTGKTPTVLFIAETLRKSGFKPAILSRGYGGDINDEVNVVCDGQTILLDSEEAGDEPVMMAKRLQTVPILTGRKRFKTGLYAVKKFGVDTLVLDDGYQHLPLHRDLNILLCDFQHPIGNGVVFPAGELREPLGAFERADLICLTRSPLKGDSTLLEKVNIKNVPVVQTQLLPTTIFSLNSNEKQPLSSLEEVSIATFCGIGQPDDFNETLEVAGARIVSKHHFPDHFYYQPEHFRLIEEEAIRLDAQWIVTSEKDSVKIREYTFKLPVFVLRVDMNVVSGQEDWIRHLIPEETAAVNDT